MLLCAVYFLILIIGGGGTYIHIEFSKHEEWFTEEVQRNVSRVKFLPKEEGRNRLLIIPKVISPNAGNRNGGPKPFRKTRELWKTFCKK